MRRSVRIPPSLSCPVVFACAVSLVAPLIGAGTALAGNVIAVGGDTGTSISAGVARLQPGDTLQIRPGVYHDAITVPCDDVTVEGAGPAVVLEGAVTLGPKDLTAAPDRPGVYTWPLPAEATDPRVTWVFYDGQPLAYQKKPLDTAKNAWCFYVDQRTRRLEVVLDGKGIPDGASLVVPTLPVMVEAGRRSHVTVRGLEVRDPVTIGISVGPDGDAEDNLVTRAGTFGVIGGERARIVRNTTQNCSGPGILLAGDGMEVADDLVVSCGIQWSDYIDFCGSETKMNAHSGCTFEQDWLVDRPMGGPITVAGHEAMADGKPIVIKWASIGGLWPDIDSFNNNFIDNAIARLGHAAIYIEYNADRNVIMANDIQDCGMGITIREGSQNLVTRNWVWDHECLGWGPVDRRGFAGFGPGYDDAGRPITSLYVYDGRQSDPQANRIVAALGSTTWGQQMGDGLCLWHSYPDMTPTSHDNVLSHNLVQVSGVAVSVPLSQYDWPSAAARQDPQQLATLSNQVTDNFYTRSPKSKSFALLGRTLVRTVARYRQLTGWDLNAHVGPYTPAVIGLEPIWTIPAAAADTHTPVSILHDPTLETLSLQSSAEPLFWHGSAVHPDWRGAPETLYSRDPKVAHSGNYCLAVSNVTGGDATAQWWTSSAIPVKPGTSMGARFWVAAEGIAAPKTGDGVRAEFLFTDATGHPVGETPLIGGGAHPDLADGSYRYTQVSGQAAVPPGAWWLTVRLGAGPSAGTVRFDDVHISLVSPAPPDYRTAQK